MIKAMIQNSSVAFSAERIMRAQEITFPCTETELSKKLGELGMNPEHLAPIATVIEIEPSELSVLTDCDVSLDALNYLGKRLDGMDKLERKQFLGKCVDFTMRNCGDINFDDCENLKRLNKKISESLPEQQSEAPEMLM